MLTPMHTGGNKMRAGPYADRYFGNGGPVTVRTPPAGTLPLVSANMSSRIVVTNYYQHFSSSPRGLAIGVDEECLELSWNN